MFIHFFINDSVYTSKGNQLWVGEKKRKKRDICSCKFLLGCDEPFTFEALKVYNIFSMNF